MKIITMERKTLDGKPVECGVGENGDEYTDGDGDTWVRVE